MKVSLIVNEFCLFPFSDSGNLPKEWPINLRNKNKFIKISLLHFSFYIIFSCYKCLDVTNLHLNKSIFNFLVREREEKFSVGHDCSQMAKFFFLISLLVKKLSAPSIIFSSSSPFKQKNTPSSINHFYYFFNSFHLNLSNQ